MIMLSFFLKVVLYVSFLGHICMTGDSEEGISASNPKYFLSVMVMERNLTSMLLEFVRHYLEEGVDHFYIYNSLNTPDIHHQLGCIDSKYYTIIPHLGEQFKIASIRHDLYQAVRNQTEWLALVDPDDFISSRAYPNSTIRELLDGGHHAVCKVIAVPTINYVWGDTQDTPVDNIRTTLTHRWGYEAKHNNTIIKKAAKATQFTDSFERAKNKIIVNTQHVRSIRTNSATLYKRGNICVSSTAAYMSCAHFAQEPSLSAPAEGEDSTSSSSDHALRSARHLSASPATQPTDPRATHNTKNLTGAHAAHLLPRYCPERNTYRSKRSMSSLFLQEQDIPGLSLAVHHYRIPSQQEWNHLSTHYPALYPPEEMALANRMDVVDPFMRGRMESRKNGVSQVAAEKIMQKCDMMAPAGTKASQIDRSEMRNENTATGGGGSGGGSGSGSGEGNDNKNSHLRSEKNDKHKHRKNGDPAVTAPPVSASNPPTVPTAEPLNPVDTTHANSEPITNNNQAPASPETSFMDIVRSFFRKFFTG